MLNPDHQESKPSPAEAHAASRLVSLTLLLITEPALLYVMQSLRQSHGNGDALLAAFVIGPDTHFDWFAARSQLLEFDLLRSLLSRDEVRQALPALAIPECPILSAELSFYSEYADGFEDCRPFHFDGKLAQSLFLGGAYPRQTDSNGRDEKQAALQFCQVVFGMRYAECSYYTSHSPWTPWFGNISESLDWTAVLLDRRLRRLWILALTDMD